MAMRAAAVSLIGHRVPDDVAVSGEVDRGGEVHGLICEGSAGPGGAARRQVRQVLRIGQLQPHQCGGGQRGTDVVVQQKPAGCGVGPV